MNEPQGGSRRVGRRTLVLGVATLAALVGAMGVLILGVGFYTFVAATEPLSCAPTDPAHGDSNYGELSWSIVPPGLVCTWTVEANGFAAKQGPSPAMTTWLLTVAALATLTVALLKRFVAADVDAVLAREQSAPQRA